MLLKQASMDGFRLLGRSWHRYQVLLLIVIGCLLSQDSGLCWAIRNGGLAHIKVNEIVIVHDAWLKWNGEVEDWVHRRLLQELITPPPPLPPTSDSRDSNRPPPPPSPAPPPPPISEVATPAPPTPTSGFVDTNPPNPPAPEPTHNETSPPSAVTPTASKTSKSKSSKAGLIVGIVIASLVFLASCVLGVLYWKSKFSHPVKPWMAGLSGQLQRAFVTGVPKLNRSELVSACEDFSNVIGTSSIGTVYKGTLSSGVEIAVISLATESVDDWSKSLKNQFRKKVDALSKINHKNFVNLIGYCEEDRPFTRMLVFEYAPNGTLFEHLHFRDFEQLNWGMRLRVAMGMAYCLEHMHQLKPPAIHKNLCSSAICLSEDYAAKVSDYTFWNDRGLVQIQSANEEQATISSNVASFGTLLFEIVTGQGTDLRSNQYIDDWASEYLKGSGEAPEEVADPTLSFVVPPAELQGVIKVIKSCVHPDSARRPSMKEVAAMMREITGMEPDGATPKISPLWWAELEVITES